jgi:hypothetical protein
MRGVAWGVEGGELEATDGDGIPVGEGGEFVRRDGEKFAPEGVHVLAINAFGAHEEAFGIEQVGCANFVDVDVGALLGQPPGSPSMIQVDVGEEDMGKVGWDKAVGFEGGGEGRDSRAGAGFDENPSVRMRNEKSGNGVRHALKVKIKGVNGVHMAGEKNRKG